VSSANKSALLVGGTGLVGGHCLQLLLASPEYSRICVIGRRPLETRHLKLQQVTVEFDALPEDVAVFGVDDVFCCLGTTIAKAGSQEAFTRVDRDYPKIIAEVAVKYGAKQFLLVSSVGAGAASSNFYLRTKGEVEGAISALPFQAVHILRPSMLLGERAEFRWKERLFEPMMRGLQWMFVGALRKYRPIEARDVARAMVNAARRGGRGVQIYEGSELERLSAEMVGEEQKSRQ
jgi:uncharacterized protein YbjT (DUF2867 family)